MCRGRRVHTAVLIAVAYMFVWLCVAGGTLRADDDDPTTIIFSGRDIWRNGAFAHGGFLIAPGGFERDGFMFKLLLGSGAYRYNAESLGEEVIGAEWAVQALPGWRIKRGDVELKFFFGPELQHHYLWPDDPANLLRGRSFGLRMAAELWYEPTAETVLIADASLSSTVTNHSARLAYGWWAFGDRLDGFYAGPETQYFGSDGYRQIRFGAHITSMKTAETEWSAAAGWAIDSEQRSSPYLRLGVMMRK